MKGAIFCSREKLKFQHEKKENMKKNVLLNDQQSRIQVCDFVEKN